MPVRELLSGKSKEEKASLKADAIVSELTTGEINRGQYKLEIVSFQKIDKGIQVFVKAWHNGKQIGFGEDGSVDIERFRIFNPPVLVSDVNGTIEKIQERPQNGEVIQESFFYREDPKEALLQTLEHTISVVGKLESKNIEKGKIGNTTSTFYPSIDGYVRRTGTEAVWATYIAAAGTASNSTNTTFGWILSGAAATFASTTFDNLERSPVVFDTSSIPDNDTITAATLSGYCTSKADEFSTGGGVPPTMTIMGVTLASDAALASGDFATTFTNHQTAFATAKAYADFTTSAYNDFTLNTSGLTAISKTGNSRFSLRFAQDVTGGTTPQQASGAREFQVIISSVDETGTSQDPKLVVTHSAGSTITLDAASSSTPTTDPSSSTTATWAHTVGSGTNRILFVGSMSDSVTGITFNGVALTKAIERTTYDDTALWYLIAPDAGTYNIVITRSVSGSIWGTAASYFGVNQSSPIDDTDNTSSASTASLSGTITSTVDNCWAITACFLNNRNIVAGANSTLRAKSGSGGGIFALCDSNAVITPAGNLTMTTSGTAGSAGALVMLNFKPALGTIKSYNSATTATVKTVLNGTAIASQKTWNGIT